MTDEASPEPDQPELNEREKRQDRRKRREARVKLQAELQAAGFKLGRLNTRLKRVMGAFQKQWDVCKTLRKKLNEIEEV